MNDFGKCLGGALDRARQRETAERAEADGAVGDFRFATHHLFQPVQIVCHEQLAFPHIGRAFFGEVERHDRHIVEVDVLPDVELGPIGDREDADALPLILLGVVEVPELGPLVLRVPAMACGTEAEDAFLGAALFLIAPRAAKSRVKAVFVERLLQTFCLPHIGVERAVIKRIDPSFLRFGVLVDQKLHAGLLGHLVAQLIHRLELPGRIDMEQREGRRRWIKRLARQMQHHSGILADGIEHHWPLGFCHNFTHDVDRLCLKAFEMGQALRHSSTPGRNYERYFRTIRVAVYSPFWGDGTQCSLFRMKLIFCLLSLA